MSVAREEELKTAQARVDELEAQLSQMHDSFEIAVAHLEKARDEAVKNVDLLQEDIADRDNEIQSANKEIESLGRTVYDLEEEVERLKDRHERELGEALDRTQLNEEMSDTLKEVGHPLKSFFSSLRCIISNLNWSHTETSTDES